jgi:flagellar motor switch protein FliM
MAEILSQSEIDSLLSALSSGTMSEESSPPDAVKGIKVYDFKHPDRFSKDQTRSLQMIHEHFARLFSTSLSTYLRSITEVHLVSVDQLSYDEFIRSIPNPTCVNLFEMDPLEGNALLEISPSLAFSIIDRLMGGKGQPFRRNREMTEIEQSIILKIIDRIFEALAEAWGGVVRLRLSLKATETNPQLFLQLYLPTEMVILMTLEVNIGENSGTFCICVPYVVLEPVAQSLSSRSWFSARKSDLHSDDPEKLETYVKKVAIPVSCYLGNTELKVSEILNLEVGDVVPLENRTDEEIVVEVSGKAMYMARPGTHRKNRAFKITRPIGSELEIE